MRVDRPDDVVNIYGSIRQLLVEARNLETSGELLQAKRFYNSILKKHVKNETAYNRLVIVYRKLKDYRNELATLDKAISVFEEEDAKTKKPKAGNIEKLSLSLGRLTGLIDKKGKSLYDPEPVATWKRRRLMVHKRLKMLPESKGPSELKSVSKRGSDPAYSGFIKPAKVKIQSRSKTIIKSTPIGHQTVKTKKR